MTIDCTALVLCYSLGTNFVALRRAVSRALPSWEALAMPRRLGLLFGLLRQEDGLYVGQDTTLGDRYAGEEFVQLLVVADSELQMPRDDTGLLVVPGCVPCQLEDFGGQVFHDGGQVHWCTGADAFGVVTLA